MLELALLGLRFQLNRSNDTPTCWEFLRSFVLGLSYEANYHPGQITTVATCAQHRAQALEGLK